MLMSVDDAARNFTALMDRVRKGETITLVDRDGTRADLRPVTPEEAVRRAEESFAEYRAANPEVDEAFGEDVEAIREHFRPGATR